MGHRPDESPSDHEAGPESLRAAAASLQQQPMAHVPKPVRMRIVRPRLCNRGCRACAFSHLDAAASSLSVSPMESMPSAYVVQMFNI